MNAVYCPLCEANTPHDDCQLVDRPIKVVVIGGCG